MLDVLHRIENEVLPDVLQSAEGWQSLDVTYEPPRVERLWRAYGEYRIFLHTIHPCPSGKKPLFHPHRWCSGIRICSGSYRLEFGFGPGSEPPPVFSSVVLASGDEYEMIHMDGWHSVSPISRTSDSVMVTGELWDRWAPKSDHPLSPLSEYRTLEMLANFQRYY